jgi:hypothetical protein
MTGWMRCPYGTTSGKLLDGMDEMSVWDDFKGSYFLPLQYMMSIFIHIKVLILIFEPL